MTFHYSESSWQEPGYLLPYFGPFQTTYKMLPLPWAEILVFFGFVHRPGHTLSRYKWLCNVEEKLTPYIVIHRKDCISYLFLLRKWMMHEILRNNLWAKPFLPLLIHLSEGFPIQSSTDSEFLLFMIGTSFFNFLQLAVSSSLLGCSPFPSEITGYFKSNFWFF